MTGCWKDFFDTNYLNFMQKLAVFSQSDTIAYMPINTLETIKVIRPERYRLPASHTLPRSLYEAVGVLKKSTPALCAITEKQEKSGGRTRA